jgi:hypothetical protein
METGLPPILNLTAPTGLILKYRIRKFFLSGIPKLLPLLFVTWEHWEPAFSFDETISRAQGFFRGNHKNTPASS